MAAWSSTGSRRSDLTVPPPSSEDSSRRLSYNHIRLIIRAGNKPLAGCWRASWGTATGPLTPFTPTHSLSHQLMMAPGCTRPMSQQLPGPNSSPSCWLCSNCQHRNKCYLFLNVLFNLAIAEWSLWYEWVFKSDLRLETFFFVELQKLNETYFKSDAHSDSLSFVSERIPASYFKGGPCNSNIFKSPERLISLRLKLVVSWWHLN